MVCGKSHAPSEYEMAPSRTRCSARSTACDGLPSVRRCTKSTSRARWCASPKTDRKSSCVSSRVSARSAMLVALCRRACTARARS